MTQYRTLKNWNYQGRYIKKGEKAVGKLDTGEALFSKNQTEKRKRTSYEREEYRGYEGQDYNESDYEITPYDLGYGW